MDVARIVRSAWEANGIDGKEMIVKSTPKEGQDGRGLLVESEDDSVKLKIPEHSEAFYDSSGCTSSTVRTTYIGTETGTGQGAGTVSTACHMSLGDMTQEDSLLRFIEAVQEGQTLSEDQWLKVFGLTEKHLRETLEPVATHILELFCFIHSGQLLANTSKERLAEIFPCDVVESLWKHKKPATMTLLKLLVVIIEGFQSHKLFLHNPICNIPCYFCPDENIHLNFNPTNNCFEMYNKFEMRFGDFSSIRVSFTFGCMLDQLLIFYQG